MCARSLLEIGGHARAVDDGDDRLVAARQVVHADEQGRALDRIELALGGAEGLVVLLVASSA